MCKIQENVVKAELGICEAIIHSDRGASISGGFIGMRYSNMG